MHDATVPERPTGVRWRVFALACGCSFLLYLHRYTWNIVGPKLQDTYQFDHALAGWVFAAFYVTYAAGQIPSGIFIDRFGPHRFLSIIAVLWSACLAGFGLTGNLWALGGLRALFGAAQAGCYPGLTKVTRSWFPLRSRTMIQGWVATTFGRAGGAMSPILLGTVLMGWCGFTWQSALWVLAGCGVVFGIGFGLLFRNTPEEHPEVNEAELSIIRDGQVAAAPQTGVLPWGQAFRNRSLRVFVVQQYLDAGSDVVFVSLIGAYFLQAHGVDIKSTGWLVSLPLWGGALGGIVGGWLNETLIGATGNRRWSRSLIGATGKIVGCVCLLLMATLANPLYAGLMLGVAKFFSDWSQPTVWGTCTDLGGRFSATVFSIINTAGTLGGVIMPPAFGYLLDAFTTTQTVAGETLKMTNWSPLFYLIAAMYFGSGFCWLLIDCTKTLDTSEQSLA
ncbi:MFS transporter [Planctellipticum variicoloris]|uniref:MFS transporter n=1 Tax=Planctellipticum variicoloris TaxID=3064265 RepID=UPI0030134F5F|nr:MFS transporter [Planctomycetaceae bacterium SH412]